MLLHSLLVMWTRGWQGATSYGAGCRQQVIAHEESQVANATLHCANCRENAQGLFPEGAEPESTQRKNI
jgi:hypothetical protein